MQFGYIIILLVLLIFFLLKKRKHPPEIKEDVPGTITVVLCNYERPHNLEKIIPVLQGYKNINEIIVTHAKKNTYKDFKGCINLQNFKEKYGATERFFAASRAKNDFILFVDDDHLPSEDLVKRLLIEIIKDPKCIYGPYKRGCQQDGYIMNPSKENYNVILTCILMTSKEILMNYLSNFSSYSKKLEKTKGNGEDITFNMNFIQNFNKKPVMIKGEYELLDTVTGAYSKRPNHSTQRTEWCRILNTPQIRVQIPRIINKIFIQHSGDFKDAFKNLELKKAHSSWGKNNSNYKIQYWDLRRCQGYLMDYFPPLYLETFNCIRAYGGKTNFFRYCLIYREGGWYSDWKQECLVSGLLDTLSSRQIEWFSCWDNGTSYSKDNDCMQNAFFGVVAGHPTIKKAIDICIDHVRSRYYGNSPLDTTGVCVFGRAFREIKPHHYSLGNYEKYHLSTGEPGGWFYYKDLAIVKHKCATCGFGQDWNFGNNYTELWERGRYYCEK